MDLPAVLQFAGGTRARHNNHDINVIDVEGEGEDMWGATSLVYLTESRSMHPGWMPHLLIRASSTMSTSWAPLCTPSPIPPDPPAPASEAAAAAAAGPPLADESDSALPSQHPTTQPSPEGAAGGIRTTRFGRRIWLRLCLSSLLIHCVADDDLASAQRSQPRGPCRSKGGANALLPATEPASSTVSAAGR